MSKSSNRSFQFAFAGEGITFAVRALILTCSAIFAAQLALDILLGNPNPQDPPGGLAILDTLVYSNDRLLRGWLWTPLTYLFLHASLWHLFMNMLQLYFFGPEVERLLGTRQFLWFYFVCGVAGVLANFVPYALGMPGGPILGASGAILGVVVAFAIGNPDRQLFLLPLPFPITARALVFVLLFMNVLQALQGGGPVAVATHLGGMAAGFAYMKARPLTLRWSWERRSRRVRREKRKANPAAPVDAGDEKQLADAIDNIFKFQDKEKR